MDFIITVLFIILIFVYFRYRKNIVKTKEEIRKEKFLNYAIIISLVIFTMVMIAFANQGSMNVRSYLLNRNQQLPTTGTVEPVYLQEEEQVMVILVNQERSREGLNPLSIDPDLTGLARIKGWNMVELDYFDHVSPVYGGPEEMVRDAGFTHYKFVSESFTKSTGSARNAFDSLKINSKSNLLGEEYTHLGIGVVEIAREGFNPYRIYVLFLAGT